MSKKLTEAVKALRAHMEHEHGFTKEAVRDGSDTLTMYHEDKKYNDGCMYVKARWLRRSLRESYPNLTIRKAHDALVCVANGHKAKDIIELQAESLLKELEGDKPE